MESLNRFECIGNLTKTPIIRKTNDGKKIASFGVAVQGYKDKVEFVAFVAFGKLADIVESYLEKGKKVYCAGKMTTSSWIDPEKGNKHYKTEIMLDYLQMLDKKEVDQNIVEDESSDTIPF